LKSEQLHKAAGDIMTDQIFSPDPQIPGWFLTPATCRFLNNAAP
jgi:hypothetical protein